MASQRGVKACPEAVLRKGLPERATHTTPRFVFFVFPTLSTEDAGNGPLSAHRAVEYGYGDLSATHRCHLGRAAATFSVRPNAARFSVFFLRKIKIRQMIWNLWPHLAAKVRGPACGPMRPDFPVLSHAHQIVTNNRNPWPHPAAKATRLSCLSRRCSNLHRRNNRPKVPPSQNCGKTLCAV